MRTYLRYLAKEWRDHRVVAIGIAVAVPPLLLLTRLFIPPRYVDGPMLPLLGAWGALALVALSFATDLVPGELRRGRMGFLARMPAGLGVPFAAKLTFLLVALLVAPAFGFAAGSMVGTWDPDRWDLVVGPGSLVLCLAPWLFAVSCWLPRGALTLPATALVLALFGLPLYLLHKANPGFRPLPEDVAGTALGVASGALLIAWISFTRGFRHGGGPLSAGWRGLLASLLVFAPVYAYSGYRVSEWNTVDPLGSNFKIDHAQVGEGDRFLFADAVMALRDGRSRAAHGLIIDLRDGAWRVQGQEFHYFEEASRGSFEPVRVLVAVRAGSRTRDERDARYEKEWLDYYDARTGERFKSAWSNDLPEEVRKRSTAGRAAWEGRGERVLRTGKGFLIRPEVTQTGWPGYLVADLVRRRRYPVPRLAGGTFELNPLVAEQGWWYASEEGHVLWDPETETESRRTLPGRLVDVWEDGRLLLRGPSHRRAMLFDPEAETVCELQIGKAGFARELGSGCVLASDGNENIVFHIDSATGKGAEILRGSVTPIAVDAKRILAIESGNRIIRVDRKTGKKSVLFPR